MASSETRVAGDLRISAAPNLGSLLLPAVARLRGAHPELHLIIVETERRLDLRNDDVDLFIRVGAVSDDRLVARLLARYPHVLVASKEYIARCGAPARPEELASHEIIAFNSRRRFRGADLYPVGGGAPVHVDLRPTLSSNTYEMIIRATRDGMGIAELPAILCAQRAGLVRILPQWTLGEVPLHLLYAADRLLPRTVRVAIDAILATVPESLRSAVADLER